MAEPQLTVTYEGWPWPSKGRATAGGWARPGWLEGPGSGLATCGQLGHAGAAKEGCQVVVVGRDRLQYMKDVMACQG